jgi:hypothetical protein
MLKKVIRRGISELRQWLHEEPPTPDWQADVAYGRLNQLMVELMTADASRREHFTWGVLQAAHLAGGLGLRRISAIEFGVAGGNGLVALENVAAAVGKMFDMEIDVFGFDSGVGLPKPKDYRDLPNLFREGAFPMNQELLRKRLTRAQLIVGPVDRTIGLFVESAPAPVGFISFDLDLYSSTVHALKLFEAETSRLMPRVHCYFDDIIGYTYSEFTGERLAIAEFNSTHALRRISPIFGLRHFLHPYYKDSSWTEQLFLAHFFDHPLYEQFDGLVINDSSGFTALRSEAKH